MIDIYRACSWIFIWRSNNEVCKKCAVKDTEFLFWKELSKSWIYKNLDISRWISSSYFRHFKDVLRISFFKQRDPDRILKAYCPIAKTDGPISHVLLMLYLSNNARLGRDNSNHFNFERKKKKFSIYLLKRYERRNIFIYNVKKISVKELQCLHIWFPAIWCP